MKKFTIYSTYILENDLTSLERGVGNSTPVHCNYIRYVDVDTIGSDDVNLYFTNPEDFRFLNMVDTNENPSGLGFSANVMKMLVQIVSNQLITSTNTYERVKPNPTEWRVYDVTSDLLVLDTDGVTVIPHTVGEQIQPISFGLSSFKFPLSKYSQQVKYDLSYINYPKQTDDANLCFGDEEFFFGNVKTNIEAIINTTDINIQLPSNEYNSTTNETWDNISDVWISEVGIYDNNNNLVAIGKLNNPIRKNSNTARTLNFAIDF